LMINRFHANLNETTQEKVLDSITIQNSASIARLIEFDFNRMGLGVSTNENSIIQADSNGIAFLSDIDENGAVDTVRYFLSDTTIASSTENPSDRILYRLINSQTPTDAAMGVTKFHIRYFDWLGYETTDMAQVKTFEIQLTVESIAPYNNRYSRYFWQTRITPPNLERF